MRFLGVDYGKRKVGLAVSDGSLASPLVVISINSLADGLAKVKHIITDQNIDQVIIGVPESGEARTITKHFIQELKKYIEVIEADETLSSHEARQLMINLQTSKKQRQKDDAHSAAIILQNYLDDHQL